ncbi:hypothetical protein WJX73_008174 [Symbiochloris irregularis]|uniref:Major facilitator superfamily (MFS) profile domain-containing protein n=1 Tax=Symbiochloris irregularis TaxID=706552 RepID=A0AAW1P354_9CHLO
MKRNGGTQDEQAIDLGVGGLELSAPRPGRIRGMGPAEDTAPLVQGQHSTDSEHNPVEAATRLPAGRQGMTSQIVLLTFISGIGGLLFGFDTGVISGALPYLRDDILAPYSQDPARLAWLQEVVVSATVVCAGLSSALGGAFSDAFGRKRALLLGDGLFAVGAVVLASAGGVGALVIGRALVGLGVGLASVTVPAYIAECAPTSIRATLVTANVFMITFGQFAAYLSDYLFTFVPGTWRWMLGVAGVPALVQMGGLFFLPESPRWLAAKGRKEEAKRAQHTLHGLQYNADETQTASMVSSDDRGAVQNKGLNIWDALKSPVLRYQLHVGVGLQVLQQAAGINTVMYFTPSILELAGFHNKRTALLVAMLPAGVNALGTVAGAFAIDRMGRRKLLMASIAGPLTDCNACIHAGCIFCGPVDDPLAPGTCLLSSDSSCGDSAATPGFSYQAGCPSPYTGLILAALVCYLASFSPGLGPVPWAINAEIFPLHMRGLGGGIAATANWGTNAVVSQTFLSLTQQLGGSGAFWLYACIALAGLAWAWAVVPETAGLSLEEVQQMCAMRCNAPVPVPAAISTTEDE